MFEPDKTAEKSSKSEAFIRLLCILRRRNGHIGSAFDNALRLQAFNRRFGNIDIHFRLFYSEIVE
jgi:hypothetical protein